VVQVNSKLKDSSVDFLFSAILSLKTPEECYAFFEDLCTVAEIKAMSQRLVVAHMLSNKKVYSDIVATTGASTATISRVNRSLHYGCDGYELAFNRLDGAKKAE
jgi:TrpR-related protein YerC/YecD